MQNQLHIHIMRKNLHVGVSQLASEEELDNLSLKQLWDETYKEDIFTKEILTLLHTEVKHSQKCFLADCTKVDGKLFFRNRQYVPVHVLLCTRLIKECHDRVAFGHPRGANTYALFF